VGFNALINSNGSFNVAIGRNALGGNTSGGSNIAIGTQAGSSLTTGNNNIDIGDAGLPGESNTIRIGTPAITDAYIRGISGATASGGATVFVNSNGKLGTITSAARFKDDITPMGKASEIIILALRPVSFRYTKEIDPQGIPQFGLVAEDVEKVNPDLIIRDADGKPYTVRYEQINAMLLNEFLKEHRRVEEQNSRVEAQARKIEELEVAIAELKSGMKTLAATANEQVSELRKVSAQLQINNPAAHVVSANPR